MNGSLEVIILLIVLLTLVHLEMIILFRVHLKGFFY